MSDVLSAAIVVVALEKRIDGAHGAVLQVVADMPVHADALVAAHGIAGPRLIVLLQQMQQAVLGGVGRLLQVHGLVGVRQADGHIPAHLIYPELGSSTAGRFAVNGVAGAGGELVVGCAVGHMVTGAGAGAGAVAAAAAAGDNL